MSDVSLPEIPASFATTRDHLHQLAFFAMSPVRYRAVGRMGLRHFEGGFGTPEFEGKRLRIEAGLLVRHGPDGVFSQPVSTIRAACDFFGVEYQQQWFETFHDPLTPYDPDRPLEIDRFAVETLGRIYGFASDVLGELCTHGLEGDEPSEVQIWPEHFDTATELGDQERGQRASYGVSPGDDNHPEPYVYVSAWGKIDRSNPYWNDQFFNGSSLSYNELLATTNPRDRSLRFLLDGHAILHGA